MDEWGSRHWQVRATQRAFERMMEEQKRSRRQDPASAIVGAARDLAADGDFTVKQVADRAGMAVQTVYRHFGSKDELVLAVLEESLAAGCEYISEVTNDITDPLDRLEQIIRIAIIAARDSPQLRMHARERVRLSQGYAPEVENALSPLRMLLIDALSQAAASGEISPVDIERDADLILHLLLSYAYAFMAHAIPGEANEVANYVWGFCVAALRRGSTQAAGHLDHLAT